jgi:segregation and condensation protein A
MSKSSHTISTAAPRQAEIFLPENNLAVRLPTFEGPLDLLLYLIRRNEVDIYDIPIETVTRQYLEIMSSMNDLDLEMAGEFFVMAATLMYIKSRMLLPQKPEADLDDTIDEGLDPRWELVQQLIEYKRFKEAAAGLEDLILHSQLLLPRQVSDAGIERRERPLNPVDRIEIWHTFNQVLRRLSERIHHGEIHAEQVTVSDQMERILSELAQRKTFLFSEIFDDAVTVSLVVATFLAILELARLQKLSLRQDAVFSDIAISAFVATPQEPIAQN